MHALQQIVEAVATGLSPQSNGNWKSLYKTRIPPKGMKFPFLQVFAEGENSELEETAGSCKLIRRESTIILNGVSLFNSANRESIEDTMFKIAKEIETRMIDDIFSAINLHDFHLDNTEFEVELDENESPAYGAILQSWTFVYYTEVGSPENLI